MSKGLIIRADSDSKIGIGHVMRMIALGQAWQDYTGGDVVFITDSPDSLRQTLEKEGFLVISVERAEIDTKKMLQQIVGFDASWFAFDGYHFSSNDTALVRQAGYKVLLLDDDGCRTYYDCDILLNQCTNVPMPSYPVNLGTKILLGNQYALLRREFRTHLRCKRIPPPIPRLLVTMGGADPDNYTLRILKAINACGAPPVKLVILLGMANPHKEEIRKFCRASSQNIIIRENVENIVDFLFDEIDYAITAASSTVFELAYFRIPMALVQTADNQKYLYRSAALCGWAFEIENSLIEKRVKEVLYNLLECRVDEAIVGGVDGKGGKRLVQKMVSMDLFFRRAGLHDARTIFEWRNHPLIRQMSSQKKSFSFEQHLAWFEGLLRSDDKYLLIGEYEGNAIGVVRFDCDTDKSASISIYLVPERINTGMGFSLLLAAVDWCWANTQVHSINAVVLQGNVASQKVFEYVGFEKVSEEAYCLTR